MGEAGEVSRCGTRLVTKSSFSKLGDGSIGVHYTILSTSVVSLTASRALTPTDCLEGRESKLEKAPKWGVACSGVMVLDPRRK